MIELHIIFALFFLSLFSVFEIVVFNEEILLAFCFFSFIFYCFNTLSDSLFQSFESRAVKFEQDLLISFDSSKQSLTGDFSFQLKFQAFSSQYAVLISSLLNFLSNCLVFAESAPFFAYFRICLAKLGELVSTTKNFTDVLWKQCVNHLLYSLVMKTSDSGLKLLAAVKRNDKIKTLCY